jgi:hypothetical protein
MAELTITLNDAHVPRVQTAMGALLGVTDGNGDPRDATAEEIRQHLVDYLKDRVLKMEMQANIPEYVDVT